MPSKTITSGVSPLPSEPEVRTITIADESDYGAFWTTWPPLVGSYAKFGDDERVCKIISADRETKTLVVEFTA